jgi:hypothetical protein
MKYEIIYYKVQWAFHLISTPPLLTRLLTLDPFGNGFTRDPLGNSLFFVELIENLRFFSSPSEISVNVVPLICDRPPREFSEFYSPPLGNFWAEFIDHPLRNFRRRQVIASSSPLGN